MKELFHLIHKERRYFLWLSIAFFALFVITMAQNVIRYGMHDTYNPWRSITYLLISLMLFLPLLPLLFWGMKKMFLLFPKHFWWMGGLTALLGVGLHYALSSVVIHTLSFYDSFFAIKYARQYFGREALYHLLTLIATAIYIYYRFKIIDPKMISGTFGKKAMTIRMDQIRWIEADDHYLKIHTGEKTLLKRYTLGKMAEDLQPEFIRIHRKYIVNKQMIVGIQKEKRDQFILLNSGEKLRVGRSYQPIQL